MRTFLLAAAGLGLIAAYALAPPAAETPAPAPAAAGPRTHTLFADGDGHFTARATINGTAVDLLVDTGATLVALTEADARRLGLTPDSYPHRVATAGGEAAAAVVRLKDVAIGPVRVRDVEAMVLEGDALPHSLLGMSFLSRLRGYQADGGRLVLRD